MSDFETIKPLEITKQAAEVIDKVQGLVRTNGKDRIAIVKKQGWIAIPVETGYHLSPEEQGKLHLVLQRRKISCFYAVAMEQLSNFPKAFSIPASSEGIEEFNRCCGAFLFTIFSGKLDWLVLCTELDFYIVAGEESFVQQFLGCSVEDAFLEFSDFISDDSWSELMKSKLVRLYKTLKGEYFKWDPGQFVDIF